MKPNICVVYSEKQKKFYFLHCKISAKRKTFYFSTEEAGAIPLPDGYEVVIRTANGQPFIRKKK